MRENFIVPLEDAILKSTAERKNKNVCHTAVRFQKASQQQSLSKPIAYLNLRQKCKDE